MGLPKRFPDRDEIADVRAEAEPLESGAQAETTRRIAGRVMARRDMGNSRRKSALSRLNFLRVVWRPAVGCGGGQSPPPRRSRERE
jgi:hypothetical protein